MVMFRINARALTRSGACLERGITANLSTTCICQAASSTAFEHEKDQQIASVESAAALKPRPLYLDVQATTPMVCQFIIN
jgi:hypothetical protein